MGSLWPLWSFADPVDTGYQSAGKHVHDRASSFAGRLGLDGNVATAAANGVVDAESVCPRATAEQQKPECDAADHRIGMFPYTRKLRRLARPERPFRSVARRPLSPFCRFTFRHSNLRPMNTLPKHRKALPDEQELRNRARAGLTEELPNIILNIMKASRKASAPEVISTHEMRFEFERVLRAVKTGRSLTLTYRGKPLARIVPLREEQTIAEDDPIFRLDELAEPIGPLTNAEIDALVYGQ